MNLISVKEQEERLQGFSETEYKRETKHSLFIFLSSGVQVLYIMAMWLKCKETQRVWETPDIYKFLKRPTKQRAPILDMGGNKL